MSITNAHLTALYERKIPRLPDEACSECFACGRPVVWAAIVWCAPETRAANRREGVLLDPWLAGDVAAYVADDGVLQARERPMLPRHVHDEAGFRRRMVDIGRAEAVRRGRCASCDERAPESSGLCSRCSDDEMHAGGRGEPISTELARLGTSIWRRYGELVGDRALSFRRGAAPEADVFVGNVATWEGRGDGGNGEGRQQTYLDDPFAAAIARAENVRDLGDGADRRGDEEGAVPADAGAPDRDSHARGAREEREAMRIDEEIAAAIADPKGSLNLMADQRFGVVPGQWHRHLVFWPLVNAILLGKEGQNETADIIVAHGHGVRVELTRIGVSAVEVMTARARGQQAADNTATMTLAVGGSPT